MDARRQVSKAYGIATFEKHNAELLADDFLCGNFPDPASQGTCRNRVYTNGFESESLVLMKSKCTEHTWLDVS